MRKLGKFLGTGMAWIFGAVLAMWGFAATLSVVHTSFPTPDTSANFGLFAAVENLNNVLQTNMLSKTIVSNNAASQVAVANTAYNLYLGTNYGSQVVALPSSSIAADNQTILYYTQAAIASSVVWTSSGASVVGGPSTMAANSTAKFVYDVSTLAWYKID